MPSGKKKKKTQGCDAQEKKKSESKQTQKEIVFWGTL